MNASFGVYPDLGAPQAAILRQGINLFQLIWPARLVANDKRIHGPFNVNVQEEEVEDLRVRPRIKIHWYTDGRAHILFDRLPDLKGAVAWMPDDPGWHNRLILADQPAMLSLVTQLRIRTGEILNADQVRLEIQCLNDVIKTQITVYDIWNQGRRIGTYKKEEDAKDWIDEQNRVSPKVQADGTLAVPKKRKTDHEIRKTTMFDYKPEIAQMISVEKTKGNQFGWSDNAEFKNKIKPEVIRLIKERRAESAKPAAAQETDILEQMANMSEEQLARVRALLFSKKPKEEGVPPVVGKVKNAFA